MHNHNLYQFLPSLMLAFSRSPFNWVFQTCSHNLYQFIPGLITLALFPDTEVLEAV